MLKLQHITQKFGDKLIVDDVNLSVQPGQVAILLGKSGVGKSTILRILSGLLPLESGTISYNQRSIEPHAVGMVFQEYNLFPHLTVKENIMLAVELVAKKTKNQAQQIAEQLLTTYQLLSLADTYPSHLSGGQKQRVAFARALALEPTILCCDEPTSALDPVLTSTVAQEINKLAAQGLTIIIATHDTQLIKEINGTIYLMADGKIIETATYQDIVNHGEKYPAIKNFTQGVTSDTTIR